YSSAGQRKFDIKFNGVVAAANYDIYAAAGAQFKAVAPSFNVTASGGSGISLELVNQLAGRSAIVSGIENTAANPLGVANPLVDLQYSPDGGGSWQPIASGLAMDHWGRGTYNWTIPAGLTPGNNYLVRAVATTAAGVSDTSDQAFLIAGSGHDFYINDNSTTSDEISSAIGDNANSGKDPSQPLASLSALLAAYDLDPGAAIRLRPGAAKL